ncbi:MAG: hypothetical protein P9L99_07070 [Candidatus Lernaella stagnicola]|nr:hypothetical protein [Candidatus Lernaella stagnicola]
MSQTARDLRRRFARHLIAVPSLREHARPAVQTPFSIAEFTGRLTEISGHADGAMLTFAFALVREAQSAGEAVAWLTFPHRPFYPPDAARNGIDLQSLVVVFCPDPRSLTATADRLARSGAFGLIALDLGENAKVPMAALSRLAGLAKKHDAVLLCLTDKTASMPSLGSLVTVHVRAEIASAPDGRFLCRLQAVKDKRRGPGWRHEITCDGPPGLC